MTNRYIYISLQLPHVMMSTSGFRGISSSTGLLVKVMKRSHSILVMIPLQYRPAIIWVKGGVYILYGEARSRRWEEVQWTSNYMNAFRHTCPLYIYELATTNRYRCESSSSYLPTVNDLQLYRDVESCIILLFIWDMQQERAWGDQFVCLEMMMRGDMHND